MKPSILPGLLLLAATLFPADADPLAAALHGQDPFAADRIQGVLIQTPRAERAAVVRRIADSGRDDVYDILNRLIQDDDPASVEIAIDALAKRWPTSMQDVELIRMQLLREGRVGAAASRYAAVVGDDEALPALAERITRFPTDADAEAALRRLTALPSGCGPEGWQALVETRQARQEAAISGAERLLGGTPAEAMGALTLIAGMRPAGSRGARVLLAAIEHPDKTVRSMATSILGTCEAPAAAVWRNRGTATEATESASVASAQPAPAAVAPPAAAVAGPTAAPTATVASAPAAAGGGGWLWLVGLAVLLGGAGWLFVRRQAAPEAPASAPQPRQGRFTWGG